MAIELYAIDLVVQFLSTRSTNRFFFEVDNAADVHPYLMAEAIGVSYFSTTDWALNYRQLLTTHCFVRSINVLRVQPRQGASSRSEFSPAEFPGLFVGQCGDNFTAAKIRWKVYDDVQGNNQVRIGPLAEGAATTTTWHPIFLLASAAFILQHTTPHEVLPGVFASGAIRNTPTGNRTIINGELAWPLSRQENRRLKV